MPSTRRRPSCSGSSAICTTARRRDWWRSRWTSAWPRRSSTPTPRRRRALVEGAHGEAKRALVELRDLSRGIYPAILTDRGLGPALSSIAARNPVEVALDVQLDGRLPAATEAAAYFVAVEALTNVAKHSRAERCRVHIVRRGDRLRVEVTDDGVGGADPAGAGLTGLRQRVEALDGALAVEAARPGTTIRAELPCAS